MGRMSTDLRSRAEELRKRCVEAIPGGYNPWLHLASTTGVGAGALALAVWGMKAVSPAQLLTIPATLLFANAFEWRVHRSVLHRRFWPLGELYDRHTPVHHGIYHTDTMAIRDWREMKLVLLPAVGVLGIVVATGPVAGLVGAAISPNVGWIFLATSATYMVSYELLHLAYHLPDDHPIAKNPVIELLRRHHAVHHDPRLMRKWNFNVTVPFFDWVRGTIAPDSIVEPPADGAAQPG